MRGIEGVLCDLDGTLVDSEDLHLDAWNLLLESHGCNPPLHWSDDCIGLPDTSTCDKARLLFPELRKVEDLLERKQDIYRELVVKRGPRLAYPGVENKLAELKAAGIKLAVGTNSVMRNTRTALEATGLDRFFKVVVTLDRVRLGKPHPGIYATAAGDLGLPPGRCVVLEDSAAGIAAGKAAGCLVFGVLNTWPAAKLAGADRIFDNTPSAMAWMLEEKVKYA